MNINQLLSTFEQRLRLQRYSEASIRNYKSAVGSFLQLASKKYDKPEDLTAKEIEKYVYWLIEKKKISASYQRMVVASIDKFYRLALPLYSRIIGHQSVKTTEIYTHITDISKSIIKSPLDMM